MNIYLNNRIQSYINFTGCGRLFTVFKKGHAFHRRTKLTTEHRAIFLEA